MSHISHEKGSLNVSSEEMKEEDINLDDKEFE